MLRDYQARAIDELYKWFVDGYKNPCLVMPTGSGKSHVIAAFCKDVLQTWPGQRILMLTHVKELIRQNAEKMRHHWPNAPMGIYSAGLNRKELDEPLTFAGVASIAKVIDQSGIFNLVIIDECHLVSHKNEGRYRQILAALLAKNPRMQVIGLTATPWRLGHGLITDGDNAIFKGIIEPISIEELIAKGYLSKMLSKASDMTYDLSKVKKLGGEFVADALQTVMDVEDYNERAVQEIIRRSDGRKSWLIFCAGVSHAEHIKNEITGYGYVCEMVTGKTPQAERDEILKNFVAGNIQAITNANVLTTGFDAPGIDLLVMLRPTMSPTLYVQMVGRGCRISTDKENCLVLDFVGNIMRHGPINRVNPGGQKEEGGGEPPIKICDHCQELVHISIMVCPACGAAFPPPKIKELELRNDEIIYHDDATFFSVGDWIWRPQRSKSNGKWMIAVKYLAYKGDQVPIVTEYILPCHDGWAGKKSLMAIDEMAKLCKIDLAEIMPENEMPDEVYVVLICDVFELVPKELIPTGIQIKPDGNFMKIIKKHWPKE